MFVKFVSGYGYFERLDFLVKYIAPQKTKVEIALRKIMDEKFTAKEQMLLRDGFQINASPQDLPVWADSLSRDSLLKREKEYMELVKRFDSYFEKTSMGKFFRVLHKTSKLFDKQFKLFDAEMCRKARELGLSGIVIPLGYKYLEFYRILSGD